MQKHGSGSAQDNGVIMALATKMAVAAKLAEERIRLDVGDDMSIEEEVMLGIILVVACAEPVKREQLRAGNEAYIVVRMSDNVVQIPTNNTLN